MACLTAPDTTHHTDAQMPQNYQLHTTDTSSNESKANYSSHNEVKLLSKLVWRLTARCSSAAAAAAAMASSSCMGILDKGMRAMPTMSVPFLPPRLCT